MYTPEWGAFKFAVTKWFDALKGDEMMWDGIRELELDEYPDVTFRCSAEKLEAVTEKETITIYMVCRSGACASVI